MALPEECPLCRAGREEQAVVTSHIYGGTGRGHAFFHCRNCDVRYQYPRLTPEEEARFYAAEFEGFMTGRAGNKGGWGKVEDHVQTNEPTRIRRMKYLKPHLAKNASLLEVGCSSGFMLFPLAKAHIFNVGPVSGQQLESFLSTSAHWFPTAVTMFREQHRATRAAFMRMFPSWEDILI